MTSSRTEHIEGGVIFCEVNGHLVAGGPGTWSSAARIASKVDSLTASYPAYVGVTGLICNEHKDRSADIRIHHDVWLPELGCTSLCMSSAVAV